MPLLLALIHPGDNLPHSDALGVPGWLQWVVGLAVIAAGVWAVIDARPAKRALAETSPEPEPEERGRERLVATSVLSEPRRPAERRTWGPVVGRLQLAARPLLFVTGGLFGWYALDRARSVEAFAGFIGSAGTDHAARLAFAFAALFWVGAALALVAPRGAALAFAGAAGIGLALATASRWEERVEWWGIGAAADRWPNAGAWSALAFALALVSLLAGWRRPGTRDFTSV
jgi:hypothetical protein